MGKNFTKSDLKNGDIILLRDGGVGIAIPEIGAIVYSSGFDYLSTYADDLTDETDDLDNSFDIIAVRRPTYACECHFCAFDEEVGKLVFDRNKDENKDDKMTMFKELYKSLSDAIKIVKGELDNE